MVFVPLIRSAGCLCQFALLLSKSLATGGCLRAVKEIVLSIRNTGHTIPQFLYFLIFQIQNCEPHR